MAVATSSAERGDRLRKLGATHVLDRAGEVLLAAIFVAQAFAQFR